MQLPTELTERERTLRRKDFKGSLELGRIVQHARPGFDPQQASPHF